MPGTFARSLHVSGLRTASHGSVREGKCTVDTCVYYGHSMLHKSRMFPPVSFSVCRSLVCHSPCPYFLLRAGGHFQSARHAEDTLAGCPTEGLASDEAAGLLAMRRFHRQREVESVLSILWETGGQEQRRQHQQCIRGDQIRGAGISHPPTP